MKQWNNVVPIFEDLVEVIRHEQPLVLPSGFQRARAMDMTIIKWTASAVDLRSTPRLAQTSVSVDLIRGK